MKDRCRYLARRPNEVWLQQGELPPAEVVEDEGLSQEEVLQQPVHIAYRPLKDPREIRMLDPACGSMHFGLYAFDLYLEIYREAWGIAQRSNEHARQGEAFTPFVTYAANSANEADFLREAPSLILQHNIYGIDIDLRAAQTARLTLWLRAQGGWQEQYVEVTTRPAITRSKVVSTEPMPGERELLADFVDQQFPEEERGLVQELLEAVFDKMQLAVEACSSFKIEEEVRDAINVTRGEWQKLAFQQKDLFSAAELVSMGQAGSSLNTDLHSLATGFWIDIEERIYTALRHYSEQAESGGSFQRSLFAEDAAQGFAFIDVCRRRYDAVLVIPPFGEAATKTVPYTGETIHAGRNDIYSAFVLRTLDLLEPQKGRAEAITSRAFVVGKDPRDFRMAVIDATSSHLSLFIDLGGGVLDRAMVETSASILSDSTDHFVMYSDLRSISRVELEASLSVGLDTWENCPLSVFRQTVDQQLLFDLDTKTLGSLNRQEWFAPDFAEVTLGLVTEENDRFLRLRWETAADMIGKFWFIFAKGGVSVQGVDIAFDGTADATRSVQTAPGWQMSPARSHRNPFLVEPQSF